MNSMNKNSGRFFNSTSAKGNSAFRGQPRDWHAKSTVKMIAALQEVLSLGFSDENWARAAWILMDLSPHCEKRHVDTLGSLMSEMYVSPSFAKIQQTCESVSEQILYSHQ